MASSSSSLKDPPKLGIWSIVCSLYSPFEKRRLIASHDQLMSVMDLNTAFFKKVMAGELFQTSQEWEDLQRRLPAAGFSDDLTLLQTSMAAIIAENQTLHPIATTTASTTATAMAGKKRTVLDCHENDNHHDHHHHQGHEEPTNRVHDYQSLRKKLKQTLRERLRRRAELFGSHQGKCATKAKIVNDFISSLQTARNSNSNADTTTSLARNNPSAASPVVIPPDSGTAKETPWAGHRTAKTAPDPRLDSPLYRNRIEDVIHAAFLHDDHTSDSLPNRMQDVIHAALRDYNTSVSRTHFMDSTSSVHSSHLKENAPTQSKVDVAAKNHGAGLATYPSTLEVDTPQSVLVGGTPTSTSTTMNNGFQDGIDDQLLASHKKSMVNNKGPTSSPTDAPKAEGVPPKDMTATTTMALPTEPKEALPVMQDSPLDSQNQQEDEVADSSRTLALDDTTVVVVPHVPHPHQGQFRNVIITLAVWSISLHGFLWTLLGTTDPWLLDNNNNPTRRICLSMETLGRSSLSWATMVESNHGQWLGKEQDPGASSWPGMAPAMRSSPTSTSSIYLHRLCTPWYGAMSLIFGMLVTLWMVGKIFKKMMV